MHRKGTFAELLRRFRAGDPAAAAELIREYEPLIRREARLRLTDPRLARLFDSGDICQSVLRSFFVRAAAGQYDLDGPKALRRLLAVMAHHKVASRARRLRARVPEEPTGQAGLEQLWDSRPGPEQVIADRDLLDQVMRHLTPEERRLADLRAAGKSWQEAAEAIGGSAESCRKQLARALDRVLRRLGVEEAA